MNEYVVMLSSNAAVVITDVLNEGVEKATRMYFPKCKILKVLAKRDTKGNGIWQPINQ